MLQISTRLLLLLYEELFLPITLQCVSKMIVNLVEEARFFQPSFLTPGEEITLRLFKENNLRIFLGLRKCANELGNYSIVSNSWWLLQWNIN
jgi:hypothetical protein